METFDRQAHWNNVYSTKKLTEVSWYEQVPQTSLDFVTNFNMPKTAAIIDVGGGDSFFVDHLLKLGYEDITVLDISEKAVERAKARLGADADKVKWIVADAATFVPERTYDLWHDRATFHFLTSEEEINTYVNTIGRYVSDHGYLVVGTFSETGPDRCSGIQVKQYSENTLSERFLNFFEKIRCLSIEHLTPFKTLQNFVFCSFRKVAV